MNSRWINRGVIKAIKPESGAKHQQKIGP